MVIYETEKSVWKSLGKFITMLEPCEAYFTDNYRPKVFTSVNIIPDFRNKYSTAYFSDVDAPGRSGAVAPSVLQINPSLRT